MDVVRSISLGIDVGQAVIVSARYINGSLEFVKDEYGREITPSYVVLTENGCIVGHEAKNEENNISGMKRVLGTNSLEAFLKAEKNLHFELVDEDGTLGIRWNLANHRYTYRPQELLSALISTLKKNAQNMNMGVNCVKAVITVPASFTYNQRGALAECFRLAEVQIIDIITDPVAAVLGCGLDKKVSKSLVLVFSLGGGTLEVSVMSVGGGDVEMKSTSGDTQVGGEEFDTKLVRHFVKEFTWKYGKDPSRCKKALRSLRTQCERAKCQLSSRPEVGIHIKKFFAGIDFSATVTRALFVELCSDLFFAVEWHTEKALRDADVQPRAIEHVILVGEGTRIPKIHQFLTEYFGEEKLLSDVEPKEVVVRGAAMRAEFLTNNFMNVTPLSIGVETPDSGMNVIIPRGTPLPIKKHLNYTTYDDCQSSIMLKLYEGERPVACLNRLLGVLTLDDITDVGVVPQIDITFEIDSFGVLEVTATDLQSDASSVVSTPTSKGCLSEIDVANIVRYSEVNREEDDHERQRLAARNAMSRCIANIAFNISVRERMSTEEYYSFINYVKKEKKWLDENPHATKEVFNKKIAQLQVERER